MNRARKVFAGIAIAGAALAMNVSPAAANTGNVSAAEDCQSWHATVSLANNVTADRAVDVVSTIPGAAGFTNHHYNTSFGEIWDANGQSPKQGTVTLNIYSPNGKLEFTDHKTLTVPEGCETTTTQPTVSSVPSTSSSVPQTPPSSASSVCTEPRGCCLSDCGPTSATNAGELPRTGSTNVGTHATEGLGAAILGSAALFVTRRKKAHR